MARSMVPLTVLLVLVVSGPSALAQRERPEQERPAGTAPQERPKEEKKIPQVEDKVSETKHSIRIASQEIRYTARAGTIVLRKEDGTPRANLFFIAYTRDDAGDVGRRPVTFTFNGGPGSSSAWLHMGAFGPRRIVMDDQGFQLPPPYRLADNEYSLLDVTDLVFIDPVTTGYSRAVPGEDDKKFHGLREDAESVGEFIRLFLTRYKRWSSPKFLAGESYGTTRAAALSGVLQQNGIYLNGIVLISSVLNFQTLDFNVGNDLPFVLYLPSYTATAWFHKKLPPDLQNDFHRAIAESEQFARGEYEQALMAGDTLSPEAHARVAEKLARYTGLSRQFVEECNLRISLSRFNKELLREQRRTVGRLDSRFTGIDADAAGDRPDYDPSMAAISGPFTAMVNDYLRSELKFETDLPYEVLTGRVRPWNYAPFENRYVNVAETLRQAMTQNQALKVFIVKGYYDMATPFFAADYTFQHLGLDASLQKNVTGTYYDAGHMMYIHKVSLEKLKSDVAQFLRSAAQR